MAFSACYQDALVLQQEEYNRTLDALKTDIFGALAKEVS